jgi:hypothetical protein
VQQPEILDQVLLDDVEPISNMTYLTLITDSFAQNKGIVFGRMQTRDRVNFQKSFYHTFYAPNLVKLLFKTPLMFNLEENKNSDEEPLISRYHPTMPLTVKNPCNNEIIVGEVEFFLLSCNRNN